MQFNVQCTSRIRYGILGLDHENRVLPPTPLFSNDGNLGGKQEVVVRIAADDSFSRRHPETLPDFLRYPSDLRAFEVLAAAVGFVGHRPAP